MIEHNKTMKKTKFYKQISILIISFLSIIFIVYPLFGQAVSFGGPFSEVMDITETGARVKIMVNCGSSPGCTDYGLEWGTSSESYTESSWLSTGPAEAGYFSFYIVLTGLSPGTTYYFRAGAEDEDSEGELEYSPERSFTTASPPSWSWPTCGDIEHNVWGWAWSENIGRISFRCSGGGIDYGVDIDEITGVFSGGAWSSNIGWISFNPTDLAGCPSLPCEARLDLSTSKLSGWAKAAMVEEKLYESYVVDYDAQFPWKNSLSGLKWQGQTFTVGAPGPNKIHRATRISLFLDHVSGATETLVVSIRTSTASPIDRCIGEIDIDPSASSYEWYDIDLEDVLSDGCILSPGTQYFIATRCPDCGGYINWGNYLGSSYSGGRDYRSTNGGVSWSPGSYTPSEDFRFKIWGTSPWGSGGWDGWIKLSGTVQSDGSPYGVSLDSTPDPSEFRGWAWGGDDTDEEAVIGWISFNDKDFDGSPGPVDYQVMTSISLNVPPTAVISCSVASCSVYDSEVLVLENNSTDPDSTNPEGNNDIVKSKWSIDGVLKDTCTSNPLCNFTPQNYVGTGSYTAELYVEDSMGNSHTVTKAFQIKRDISAAFSCSLDEILWEVCEDITPTEEETVYFKGDDSMASEGATITTWVWEKDGSPLVEGIPRPATGAVFPSMKIRLTVADSVGREASVDHDIGAKIALPTWKEIPPF